MTAPSSDLGTYAPTDEQLELRGAIRELVAERVAS
jgi:hypothetical protein